MRSPGLTIELGRECSSLALVKRRRPRPAADTAWEDQATWYDARHGQAGDAHHRRLIVPAILRQLRWRPGERVLDCCCGAGVVGRALAEQGLQVHGIDAAPSLISAAQERGGEGETYTLGDAHQLADQVAVASYAHAVCVLALQDLDPIDDVLAGIARALVVGGRVVLVLTHPCFRIPRQADWTWQGARGGRRIDAYLSHQEIAITHHQAGTSRHFHRPLQAYLNACGAAGLPIIASEELCTPRRGSPGPRHAEEDRLAREFPVFLVLTGERQAASD